MTWPTATLESIYVLYPNKQDKKTTLRRIGEALDRIMAGEIDSKPRTQEEAVTFLRNAVQLSRTEFAGRDKHFIPHSTTYFRGSRYLQIEPEIALPPERHQNTCIRILSKYPTCPKEEAIRINPKAFAPALNAIHKALAVIDERDLENRVSLYAACVSEWPKDDRRYIPNARRWFEESRFLQDEQLWRRKAQASWGSEREQIAQILGVGARQGESR